MPADYLSRLPSSNETIIAEITECFDPFQPDLKDLQRADTQLQNLNHFRIHGQWVIAMPKWDSNYLQDSQNIVWVRLDDYKYPRTALFLPQKNENWLYVRPTTTNVGATMPHLKLAFRSFLHISGLKCTQMSWITQKHVYHSSKEKSPRTNHRYCNHCQLQTSPTSGFTQTFSAQCSLLDGSTNTFSASPTYSQSMR